MLGILSPFDGVPILTSAPLWTVRPFVELSSDNVLCIQKSQELLCLIHNTISKLYPLLCQPCSSFELVLFTPEVYGICFYDALMG